MAPAAVLSLPCDLSIHPAIHLYYLLLHHILHIIIIIIIFYHYSFPILMCSAAVFMIGGDAQHCFLLLFIFSHHQQRPHPNPVEPRWLPGVSMWVWWKPLQSGWWLEVTVMSSLQLHPSPPLATDTGTGLKWKNILNTPSLRSLVGTSRSKRAKAVHGSAFREELWG